MSPDVPTHPDQWDWCHEALVLPSLSPVSPEPAPDLLSALSQDWRTGLNEEAERASTTDYIDIKTLLMFYSAASGLENIRQDATICSLLNLHPTAIKDTSIVTDWPKYYLHNPWERTCCILTGEEENIVWMLEGLTKILSETKLPVVFPSRVLLTCLSFTHNARRCSELIEASCAKTSTHCFRSSCDIRLSWVDVQAEGNVPLMSAQLGTGTVQRHKWIQSTHTNKNLHKSAVHRSWQLLFTV